MRRPLGMQRSTSRNSKPVSPTSRASTSQNVTKEDLENFVLKNKLTALVVDDSGISRLCHNRLLNSLGVECRDVSNGQDAVALCREGAVFNLILMDMEMPIMNGPEATKILREIGVHSMIIGVSSHNKEWEIREFMEAGLDGFYEKPLTRENMVLVLRELDDSLSP